MIRDIDNRVKVSKVCMDVKFGASWGDNVCTWQ